MANYIQQLREIDYRAKKTLSSSSKKNGITTLDVSNKDNPI